MLHEEELWKLELRDEINPGKDVAVIKGQNIWLYSFYSPQE